MQDGKVTPKGLASLREKMPYSDIAAFEKDPSFEKIGDLFTVDLIVNYVRAQVAAK